METVDGFAPSYHLNSPVNKSNESVVEARKSTMDLTDVEEGASLSEFVQRHHDSRSRSQRLSASSESPVRGRPNLRAADSTTSLVALVGDSLERIQQTTRKKLQAYLESPRFELATLTLVLVYGLMVLCDLGVSGLDVPNWKRAVKVLDGIFLSLFLLEVVFRLYVFGAGYLKSILDVVDLLAIVISFLMMLMMDWAKVVDKDKVSSITELLLAVRFLRVFRLAAVMLRSIKTAANFSDDARPRRNSTLGIPSERVSVGWAPPKVDPKIYEIGASREMELLNLDVRILSLLTSDFTTLLQVYKHMDSNHDGELDASELIPGLVSITGLSYEEANSLFGWLDQKKLGKICVTDLYYANQVITGLPSVYAKVELEQVLETQGGGCCSASNVVTHVDWWVKGRWRGAQDLRYLTTKWKTLQDDEKVPLTLPSGDRRPMYQFVPGKVDLITHFNGSGSLLIERAMELCTLVKMLQHEVSELSHKLQEVEIGQPRDVDQNNGQFIYYQTYLLSLAKALPYAMLHLQPFHGEGSGFGGYNAAAWIDLRHKPKVVQQVQLGAKLITLGLLCQLFGRLTFLLVVYRSGEAGDRPIDKRMRCEELWASGNVTNATDAGDGDCNAADGPMAIFAWSVIVPALGILTIAFTPLLFKDNANAVALKRLLGEPRVLLIMLQAVTRTGLTANNITRFPVAIELYSVPIVGASMMAGRLCDLLFFPCSIIVFILMDACVTTAPRMRCLYGVFLLFFMSSEIFENDNSQLPSVLELQRDWGYSASRKLDFSLLLMLASAILSTASHPHKMNFISNATEIMELVIFDEGAREVGRQDAKASRHIHQQKKQLRHTSKDRRSKAKEARLRTISQECSPEGSRSWRSLAV